MGNNKGDNMTDQPKLVLVADDEQVWIDRIKKALAALPTPYTVVEAHDYESARSELEKRKFDLVVSDNGMPLRNAGLSLLSWMRFVGEHNQETPFVLHTADESMATKRAVVAMQGVHMSKLPIGTLESAIQAAITAVKTPLIVD